MTFNIELFTFEPHKNTNTMNKRMTSYEYKQKKIAELEAKIKQLEIQIVSLDGENNRLYQQACETEKELQKYKRQPTPNFPKGGHENIGGEFIIPKTDPKPEPVDPYKVFKDAIKEGKTVQYKREVDNEWEDPLPHNYNQWSWCASPERYRIKPEPVYIPFTFADAEQLIGKAVKSKASNEIGIITGVIKSGVYITNFFTYEILLKDSTFLDNSPCGKLAE